MKVVDIANEIYLENASPSDTSVPAIAFWLRSNVGKLNTLLYEAFVVDATTLEIVDACGVEITDLAASVLKTMYKVYRVELDIREMIAGLANNMILEAKDQDFSVKRLNRSEILKTFTAMKKDLLTELNGLVHNYHSYHGAPQQVAGDDTQKGYYVGSFDQYSRNVTTHGGN